jgi:hypothetical protein
LIIALRLDVVKKYFFMPFLKHDTPCTTVRGIIKVELHIIVLYETEVRTQILVVMCRLN